MQIIGRIAAAFISTILAKAILAWLATLGIYPDRWIASMLTAASSPEVLDAVTWTLLALAGVIGLVFGPSATAFARRLFSGRAPIIEHATRLKFSDTQTVTGAWRDGDNSLNLDHAARLVEPCGGWNLDTIDMMLMTRPAIEMPGHKFENAEVGPIRFTHLTPDVQRFKFSARDNPTHVVEVGTRKFRVTLVGIADKSIPTEKIIEYRFSIYEQ